MAIQEQYEETKQSIIHTYCVVADAAVDTYFAGCIVKPVNATGGAGQVELATDATALYAGVIHCPGRKHGYKAGDAVAIIRTGTVLIPAGAGGILPGDAIIADANGKGIKGTAGCILGYARNEVTNAGEYITVELNIGKI